VRSRSALAVVERIFLVAITVQGGRAMSVKNLGERFCKPVSRRNQL
jgi:hypothetical protein